MIYDKFNQSENAVFAYLLVDVNTSEVLNGNKLAWILLKGENGYPPLDELFFGEDIDILASIRNTVFQNTSTLESVTAKKSDGTEIMCHMELCRINENLIFLSVKEHANIMDSDLEEIVELSGNPFFVLEHSPELKMIYGDYICEKIMPPDSDSCSVDVVNFADLLPDDLRLVFLQTLNDQFDQRGECEIDIELHFGTEYARLFRFSAFKSTFDGNIYGQLITVKKQSDLIKKIEYDQQYFDIMQKYSKDLLFRIDIKKRTFVHRGDISMFADLAPEVKNFPESIRDCRLVHPDDLEGYVAFAYRLMSGVEASFEPRFLFKNGTYEKYRLQGTPLFDANGNTVQVVGKCENIQKYVEIEAKAKYDALTTTLNKQSFKELVENSIERAVAFDKFSLLFIDLDDFKGVNDTMGHAFGDMLLEAMGKRILNCVRSQDRVGRVGGDEFVVFFQLAPSHDVVLERAEAILYSLRREFTFGEQRCKTRASIGISMFPEHGGTYAELYAKADKALYESKALGKDVATIYKPELGEETSG